MADGSAENHRTQRCTVGSTTLHRIAQRQHVSIREHLTGSSRFDSCDGARVCLASKYQSTCGILNHQAPLRNNKCR